MARITLEGFYRYYPDLFDGMILPTGMDKTIMIDVIFEKSGMLFPAHQQPDYLKVNIGNWFQRKLHNFQCMYDALQSEYNPIENYDRKEDWTETPDIAHTKTGGHTNTINNSNSGSAEGKVSAFNSSEYQPDTNSTTTGTGHSDETFVYNTEQEKETGTRTHSGRMHGNIGVTTNQQMIQSELELRIYDLYETIAEMFEKYFLIQVY